MSGGEASSSSTTEERTYQTPPPDMSRGPPWPAAQPAPPPPPAKVGTVGGTVPVYYPPPPPKAETEGGTVPAYCPPPPPSKVVLIPKKGPKPPPPLPTTAVATGMQQGKAPPPPKGPPLKANVSIRGLPTGPGSAGFADPVEGDAEDLWCPNKILREDLEKMIEYDPEMYANYRGMEIDYTQVPLWRVTEEEQYKPRNNRTVEEWLSSLRKKNLKEKEEVATIARRIKEGFWKLDGGRASRELRDRAGDKLTEQHSVAEAIRLSP
eukprot:3732589-Amphidinium_carterae.1